MGHAQGDYEQILVERRDAIGLLTLNRPERLNAWTPQMSAEMTDAIARFNDDPSIGAIVVTGAGRGCCAGADIGGQFAAQLESNQSEASDAGPAPTRRAEADWVKFCRASKPLVAAINGPAIGVGLTMVLPFDRLVAGRSAKISARFVRMGLVPELASSHFLVARCGWGAASWLALTGTTIDGGAAAEMRLVDRAVYDDSVLDEAMADATQLAASPPPQVRMIKDLLTANAVESDLALVQQRELAALKQAYTTPEHREAVSAFLERRQPDFRPVATR
jgi:2-(1,2-epoxy-1,2-dihydrophenyl)acetyl-CoA isomerase